MAKRTYGAGVTSALLALCRGTCYAPGCGVPVVRFLGETPMNNLEIAHIYALHPNGPRYVAQMSIADRNAFSNLILLCHPHHTLIDKISPSEYPAYILIGWKKKREAGQASALQAIGSIDEIGLQDLVKSAFEERDRHIEQVLEDLNATNREAAQVMQELRDELQSVRRLSTIVDPDTVDLLNGAANLLTHLPDTAPVLMSAASTIEALPDLVEQLSGAVDNLRRYRDSF